MPTGSVVLKGLDRDGQSITKRSQNATVSVNPTTHLLQGIRAMLSLERTRKCVQRFTQRHPSIGCKQCSRPRKAAEPAS